MSLAGQESLDQAARKAPPSAVEAAARVLEEAGTEPARAAFVTRVLNLLAQVTDGISARSLSEVLAVSSDYEVLIRALAEPETLAILQRAGVAGEADPLAAAHLRGLLNRERLLQSEGGAVSVDEAARLLGITPQAVNKRRQKGALIGLTMGRRGYLYPIWQFDRRGSLAGLEAVLAELRGYDPWMQVAFIVNANLRLDGETPLSELRRGHLDSVLRAARLYGQHGAA